MTSLCTCGHAIAAHGPMALGCNVGGCDCMAFVEKKDEPKITLTYISKQEYDKVMNKEVFDQLLKNPNIKWEHDPNRHEVSAVPNFLVEKENLNPPTLDLDTWKKDMHGPDVPEELPKKNDLPAIWDLVIDDMKKRDQLGLNKYGMHLQAFNGRDALWDAYQEALDLVVYLRQAIFERDDPKIKPLGELEELWRQAILLYNNAVMTKEEFLKTVDKKNYDGDADEKNKTVPDNL